MAKKSSNLPLKSDLQEKFAELDAINIKLHSQLIKCQMENQSLKNRIKALEQELENEKKIPKVSNIQDTIARITKKNVEERKNRTKN